MTYQLTNIKTIAEQLRWNYQNNHKTVLLLGAGVSVSAGIPTANGIIEKIKKEFPAKCECLISEDYQECMKVLTPMQRREIINKLIENSKLNAAHLYMSTLVKHEYVDRILTTNFDTLVAKSLAIENVFPGIYDLATSAYFVPGESADVSIFHLHGQKDGFILLNTKEEVTKHFETIKPIFDDTLIKRTVIVVGYSGQNDPVFEHLTKIPRYENHLYWVGFNDEEPTQPIQKNILSGNKYAYYLKGYDADSFFIALVNELKLSPPRILSKPFSYLEEVLQNIGTFTKNDKETDPAKETKDWVNKAIKIFENKEDVAIIINQHEQSKIKDEELIKLVRDAWMNDDYEKENEISQLIKIDSPEEAKKYYSYFLNDSGVVLSILARTKQGDEAQKIYQNAIKKYKKAIDIKPNDYEILNNWGLALSDIGEYDEAIEKYKKAADLKPDFYDVSSNWGLALSELGKYDEAIEKYKKAIDIKPDSYETFNNWGLALSELGKYDEAIEKYKKAAAIKLDSYEIFNSWGLALSELGKYDEAIEKYKKAADLKPDDYKILNNWGLTLSDIGKYDEAIKKYKKAAAIKPDDYEILNNWGKSLVNSGRIKEGSQAEEVYKEALELLFKGENIQAGSCSYDIACIYSLLKNKEKSIEYLERAFQYNNNCPSIEHIKNDPDLAYIIDDERVQKLLDNNKINRI